MATASPGRGARVYYFAHKICNHYLRISQSQPSISAVQDSYLSVAFLFGDIENGGRHGADRAADKVTVIVPQRSYIRIIPAPPRPSGTLTNVGSECYHHVGLNKEHSLPHKTQDRSTEINLPRYRGFIKFRRTFRTSSFSRRLHNPDRQRLCWGLGQCVFIRAYTGNGTRTEPLCRSKTGYYDVLEVTPSATRAQIKTAYYKLSFVYHPDRNAGGSGAATVRFSEISEAYTVLGNDALRRKYDRGVLVQSDLVATARPSGRDTAGGSGEGGRRSAMDADGGGALELDRFFKAHYHEQLRRERDARVRREELRKRRRETIEDLKWSGMTEVAIGMMVLMAGMIVLSLKRK